MALSEAEKYRLAQKAIRGQVVSAVNRLYAEALRHELGPEAIRDLFLDRMPLLVERFGEDAGFLAAEWYDVLRARHGSAAYYRAEMAPLTEDWQEMIEATVRRTAGHLFTETPERMLAGVVDTVDKIVGEAASRTVAHSAGRDPDRPRYKVTLSAKACEYCRDVAAEVERLHAGDQPTRWFHGNCRCSVEPTWR